MGRREKGRRRSPSLQAEPLESRRLLAAAPSSAWPVSAVTPVAVAAPEQRPFVFSSTVEQAVEVSADIARNTTFVRGSVYLITAEVHVLPGVTLTIEDGVTVLIRNGRVGRQPGRLLDRAALVFDSGSRLVARSVSFAAADRLGRPAADADNGGVFFLGSFRNASKDGVSVSAGRGTRRSSFTADEISVSFLGRPDPRGGDGNGDDRDDIDALSVLGVGQAEWRVRAVRSIRSGDDGFDVTNSSITLDRVTIQAPTEDGLNLSSSSVSVRRSLAIDMSAHQSPDRELFDLEADDGPARVLISRSAFVDLAGIWGDRRDEVRLTSLDMPQPNSTTRSFYSFRGQLRRGPAIVYSIRAD